MFCFVVNKKDKRLDEAFFCGLHSYHIGVPIVLLLLGLLNRRKTYIQQQQQQNKILFAQELSSSSKACLSASKKRIPTCRESSQECHNNSLFHRVIVIKSLSLNTMYRFLLCVHVCVRVCCLMNVLIVVFWCVFSNSNLSQQNFRKQNKSLKSVKCVVYVCFLVAVVVVAIDYYLILFQCNQSALSFLFFFLLLLLLL